MNFKPKREELDQHTMEREIAGVKRERLENGGFASRGAECKLSGRTTVIKRKEKEKRGD